MQQLNQATTTVTPAVQAEATQLLTLLHDADAIVVGVGAGLPASDGFTYTGERFRDNFSDFIEAKGFIDMLQAFVSDEAYSSLTEYWAFKSRFVVLNALDQPVGMGHIALRELLEGKQWHLITTNADNGFRVAGYEPEKLFYYQGEYALMQCRNFCHSMTYRDDRLMRQMATHQENCQIDATLIPYCPVCGAPLEINKRVSGKGMVESPDWVRQNHRYRDFLTQHQDECVLYLEIGVGNTTPQFIRQPFQQRVLENPNARYVMMNAKPYRIPATIQPQTVRLREDIQSVLLEARNQQLITQAANV
ncbi:MAG: deacetylase SIR2 [Aerococcus sp.]|nr:deacetylase SIR2 [Aerococcus sp.]